MPDVPPYIHLSIHLSEISLDRKTYSHHDHLRVHQSLRMIPRTAKVELERDDEQHPRDDFEDGVGIGNGR